MASLPLLVSGWYWWYAPPETSWVAASSRMRSRARPGASGTKPSRSWQESRNPMPREIPDSNSDTERLMLKVTMH